MAKQKLTNEIVYEEQFVSYAAKHGCYAYKFQIPARRGAPDRIVFCPNGRTLFLEFKREDGKLSKQQISFRKILKSIGFTVDVVYTLDEACDALDRFLENPNDLIWPLN